MRPIPKLPLLGASMLALAACGAYEQQSAPVTKYYIEPSGNSGDALPNNGAPPNGPSQTGDGSLKLTVVAPAADVAGGGTVHVQVSFADPAAAAYWCLLYAQAADDSDAEIIQQNMPLSQTTVDWDTSGLAAGSYHFFAEMFHTGDDQNPVKFPATAKVTVGGSNQTAGNPTLALTSPKGQEVFVAGTPRAVTFTATSPDNSALTYKVEYSADGGTTWKVAADAVTASPYMWNVQGLTQGINYKLRVTAADGKGGTATAVSAAAFGVATAAPTFAGAFGAMLKSKCGACHNTGAVNAAQFTDDNLALATIGVKDKGPNIKNRAAAGTMPPQGSAPLAAADKDLIQLWIWNGSL